MHKLLLLFCLLFSVNSFSQAKKIKIQKKKEKEKIERKAAALTSMTSIDVYYGNLVFKDNFYGQLNTRNTFNINTPPTMIGIGLSGLERHVGAGIFVFQIDAQKYIPHPITINDSIHTAFSGASFGLGVGKRFTTNNRNLTIAIYLGFNSGRSTLKNSENISYQKQFFCPKISIQPKFMIKRLAISLIIAAQGDPTSAKWLPTYLNKKSDIPVTGLYQTGIIGLVGLGYRIGYF